jgi:hypothetical protein
MHDGSRYAGNIRLDASDRDRGKVHFAYFVDLAEWKDQDPVQHALLGLEHGVRVTKLAPLLYRVTQAGKSVEFELNDLSGVKPPDGLLSEDERYIGPVFDESGIRFFLVYNGKLKLFHYLLDETIRVGDQFFPANATDRIVIGKRPASPSIGTTIARERSSSACSRGTRGSTITSTVHSISCATTSAKARRSGARSSRCSPVSQARSTASAALPTGRTAI